MLSHIHLSSVRPGRVPSSSKSGGTFRPAVRCAAVAGSGTGKRQQGWHWPLGGGQRAAENDDDAETEIVYVTDTAEADEVIEEEEPDQVEISAQHDQQAAAARTSLDLIQRHQPVVSTPPAPSDDQVRAEGDRIQQPNSADSFPTHHTYLECYHSFALCLHLPVSCSSDHLTLRSMCLNQQLQR